MVLVGVHPSLMQVPPTCTRSTMAVFHPALAKAVESGPPAWPAPMTMASYCVVINAYLSVSFRTRAGAKAGCPALTLMTIPKQSRHCHAERSEESRLRQARVFAALSMTDDC